MRWFYLSWWRYLFAPVEWDREEQTWQILWCRLRGHPAGVIWYSSGNSPDMRCQCCGDDLG